MTPTAESTSHTPTLGPPIVDTGIIDADIHPMPPPGALAPYLTRRWQDHVAEYGRRTEHGLQAGAAMPSLYGGMRADAWPEGGGFPGSDLGLIQTQLLDKFNIQLGLLECLTGSSRVLNEELGAALVRAENDWQLEHLVHPEPRLRMAMLVQQDVTDLAVREIERIGDHPGVLSVLFNSHGRDLYGSRRYWPIYEAAVARGLPIQAHVNQGGGHANTGTGWTSYYAEYHVAFSQTFQAHMLSLIVNGVFERFPDLKFMLVEGGVLHYPALLERLDFHWENLRSEVPGMKRKPSEYVRDHFWVTTQPIEEPHDPTSLVELIQEFGEDNVLFSSDYPHWDFDSPTDSLPRGLPEDLRGKLFRENGKRLFGLGTVAA